MGIRFHCQKCKKRLNVKSSQAKQKGVCPYCKTTVIVPTASSTSQTVNRKSTPDPNSDLLLEMLDLDEQDTAEGDVLDRRSKSKSSSATVAQPKPKKRKPKKVRKPKPVSESSDSFMLDKPAPPASRGKVDPIAEAPNRVWYFRSHALGEKGPLKAKAMQAYVDKGDVKVGCIVWREDWDDWLPAEDVFPALAAEVVQSRRKEKLNRAFKDANYEIPDELNPQSAYRQSLRKKRIVFVTAIVAGLLTVMGLVYLLVKVVG
jgi:DNA-directed RNA polymerase subunit RPC12/RpoP